MQTLYIDVYFLLNFTVDILALYFAVSFASLPTTPIRLIFGGILGAVFATLAIFIDDGILKLLFSFFFATVIALVSVRGASFIRRLKFFFAFLVFETLTGGAVYYGYSLLDKYIGGYVGEPGDEENRQLIIIGIIILLSVGVFKLFIGAFTSEARRGTVTISIEAFGATVTAEAFVDSGNLLRDPTDMRPVILIKERLARKIFPKKLISGSFEELSLEERRRLRLIPISREGGVKILVGIRPNRIFAVSKDGKKEEIDAIIAVDKEGGAFGGQLMLLPSSVVEDVI